MCKVAALVAGLALSSLSLVADVRAREGYQGPQQQKQRQERGLWDTLQTSQKLQQPQPSVDYFGAKEFTPKKYSDNPLTRFILEKQSPRKNARSDDGGGRGGGGGGFWKQISKTNNKEEEEEEEKEGRGKSELAEETSWKKKTEEDIVAARTPLLRQPDVDSEEDRRRALLRKIAAKLLSRKRKKYSPPATTPTSSSGGGGHHMDAEDDMGFGDGASGRLEHDYDEESFYPVDRKDPYVKDPYDDRMDTRVRRTTERPRRMDPPSPTVGILAGPKTMIDYHRLENPIPHDDWNKMIKKKKRRRNKEKSDQTTSKRTTTVKRKRFRPRPRQPIENDVPTSERRLLNNHQQASNRRIDVGEEDADQSSGGGDGKSLLASQVNAVSVLDMVRSMQDEIRELNEQIKEENKRIAEEEQKARQLEDSEGALLDEDGGEEKMVSQESQGKMDLQRDAILESVREIKLRKEDAKMKAIETQIKLRQVQEANTKASEALDMALNMVAARRKLIREALKQQRGLNVEVQRLAKDALRQKAQLQRERERVAEQLRREKAQKAELQKLEREKELEAAIRRQKEAIDKAEALQLHQRLADESNKRVLQKLQQITSSRQKQQALRQRAALARLKKQRLAAAGGALKTGGDKPRRPLRPTSPLLRLSADEMEQILSWLDLERNAPILEATDKKIAAKLKKEKAAQTLIKSAAQSALGTDAGLTDSEVDDLLGISEFAGLGIDLGGGPVLGGGPALGDGIGLAGAAGLGGAVDTVEDIDLALDYYDEIFQDDVDLEDILVDYLYEFDDPLPPPATGPGLPLPLPERAPPLVPHPPKTYGKPHPLPRPTLHHKPPGSHSYQYIHHPKPTTYHHHEPEYYDKPRYKHLHVPPGHHHGDELHDTPHYPVKYPEPEPYHHHHEPGPYHAPPPPASYAKPGPPYHETIEEEYYYHNDEYHDKPHYPLKHPHGEPRPRFKEFREKFHHASSPSHHSSTDHDTPHYPVYHGGSDDHHPSPPRRHFKKNHHPHPSPPLPPPTPVFDEPSSGAEFLDEVAPLLDISPKGLPPEDEAAISGLFRHSLLRGIQGRLDAELNRGPGGQRTRVTIGRLPPAPPRGPLRPVPFGRRRSDEGEDAAKGKSSGSKQNASFASLIGDLIEDKPLPFANKRKRQS